MKFTLTFTQDQIVPAKKQALQKVAEKTTLKGFRQGKAPLDLVEKAVGDDKLIEETINQLIPEAYSKYISEHKLQPITQPKISLKKMVPEGEWEFDVEIAEKPEVKLNNYLDAIKGEKAKDVIWTPEKGDVKPATDPKAREAEETKKLTMVFDTLLKTAEVEISDLLIDEEVNRALARLLEQINKLGLTIDQYLSSIGKTSEALREEYKTTALNNLKLEFILDAVIKDQHIEVTPAEVDQVLQTVENPKDQESVRQSPIEMATIKYNLAKHKAVDYLMSL